MAACHPPTRPIPSAVVTVGFGAEPEAGDVQAELPLRADTGHADAIKPPGSARSGPLAAGQLGISESSAPFACNSGRSLQDLS